MSKSKKTRSKQDRQWAEAKKLCRLNVDDIRMAKELGFKPRSLIKAIPSRAQPWKAPVKIWIHDLYARKFGEIAGLRQRTRAKTPNRAQGARCDMERLEIYEGDPAVTADSDDPFDETMGDWEAYLGESWDDDEAPASPESSLHSEIHEEDQRAQRRQQEFRLGAEYVARALAQISAVEKIVLFGSVARPLQAETPRFRKYRRADVPMLHMCQDVDLAVWVSDLGCLRAMQLARSRALNQLWQERQIGVAHHQVDVFIMDPASDRYLGRLCTYGQCPKGKPECRVAGCGSTSLLRLLEDFELDDSALDGERIAILYDRRAGSDVGDF